MVWRVSLSSQLLVAALVCPGFVSTGMAAFPTLHMKPVVLQQMHSPTCIVAAPDGSGRLFVCDQPGVIYIVEDGMRLPVPFLDISNAAVNVAHRKVRAVGGASGTGYDERGLLSLAFHPGYASPASPGYRKFYLNYNKAYEAGIDPPPHQGGTWTPNCTTVIAEFQATANSYVADPLSERKILLYPQPQSNHNGGGMVFDAAGRLYIGSGDGGSANDNNVGHSGGAAAIVGPPAIPSPSDCLGNGQDKTVYLGKILRIDPLDPDGAGAQTYSIPADNPFYNDATPAGLKKEIFAFGIRNPWGISFDDGPLGTGRLFCADVGQGRIEEVNLITSGGNYGWRYKEGLELPVFSSGAPTNPMPHPGGTLTDPIAQYGHPGITGSSLPLLGLSITGGYVYRGSAIPALQGKYVFGDYGATSGAPSGRLMGLEETLPGSGVFTLTEAIPLVGGNPISTRVMCLGRDSSGELYVGTKSSGGVMALENGLPNGGLYKLVPAPASPAPVVLTTVKDNSIFEETGGMGEELSNGTGDIFIGTTSTSGGPTGTIRRGLLAFDLSSVPADSRFGTAILQVNLKNADTHPNATLQRNTFLNRVLASWGEAGSFSATGGAVALTGDATWFNRFYSPVSPTAWTVEGGDYSIAVSSSFGMGSGTGFYAFQGPQMTNDVHAWLAAPSGNHGWMIRSDEGVNQTRKTLDSRESADAAKRPTLTLVHATPYEKWLSVWYPSLLVGQFVDLRGDVDGDGIAHQLEYAFGLSPLSRDAASGFSVAAGPLSAGSRVLTMTFRRDTAATDLTYRLEISASLGAWTPVAQSTGGSAPVGQNGGAVVSDTTVSGTVKLVTVTRVLSGADADRQFVRVAVDRAP